MTERKVPKSIPIYNTSSAIAFAILTEHRPPYEASLAHVRKNRTLIIEN